MNNIINNPNQIKVIHFRNKEGSNSLSLHGFTQKELRDKLYNSITNKETEVTQFYITELNQMHKTTILHTIQDLIIYSALVITTSFIKWAWNIYNQLRSLSTKDTNKQKQLLLTLGTQLSKKKLNTYILNLHNKLQISNYNRTTIYINFNQALVSGNTNDLIDLILLGDQYELIHEKDTPNKNKLRFLLWSNIMKYAKNDFISDIQLSTIETFFDFYKIFYKLKKNHNIFMIQAIHTLYSPLDSTQIEEYHLIPLTEVQAIYSKRWHYKVL